MTSYPRFLRITWRVSGTDHDGYCSGQDGGYDIEPYEETEIIENVDKGIALDDLAQFDFFEGGCTSTSGSGCCKNIGRHWKTISVVPVNQ